MLLKNDNLFVTIGQTVFRSSKTGFSQFVFDPEALQGFFDGVGVKRTDTVRPNQWGDFSEPNLLGPRRLTLTGTAVASSTWDLLRMRDEFTALLVEGFYQEISVQNSVETRYITVTLEGTPSWVQKLDTVAVWKLELYAPDPRMYGFLKTVQITDGSVTGGMNLPVSYPINFGGPIRSTAISVENNGNTKSWPVFKITGNYPNGFNLTDGINSFITFDGMVDMSAPVFVDTGKGTATQGGVDRSSLLSRRDWFYIPPKSSIAPKFLPFQDAAGWCDIMYRDTWI
ncbi:minor tail protein [Arthrobacter phage Racecar]|nr:minor tail protein [Arthrobacter phage Racecar]QFG12847.1 minor tail protein [Arthrobacter phage Mimi]